MIPVVDELWQRIRKAEERLVALEQAIAARHQQNRRWQSVGGLIAAVVLFMLAWGFDS